MHSRIGESCSLMKRTFVETDEHWRKQAACRGMDTEMFYPVIRESAGRITPETRKQVRDAIAVCRQCPVKVECYSHAVHFDERYGIWGGQLFHRSGGTTHYGLGGIA